MNVLVTGGCGFVGYALTKELLLRGYNVDVIDNLSIGNEAKEVVNLGANFLGGDVREMSNMPLKKYKYIFHLAALSRIQPSFKFPWLTFDCNVEGTKQVVDYALQLTALILYKNTDQKTYKKQ